ncbi:17363_t:CDS:2, partial [Racocetra fulgida]
TIAYVYDKLAYQNGFNAVFDGNTSIYSATPLTLENERGGNHFELHVSQNDDYRVRNGSYKVIIRFIQELSFDELQKFVTGSIASVGEVIKCIMALNTYINFTVRRNYPAIGRSIFPHSRQVVCPDLNLNPIVLPGAFELRLGFYQSLRPVWISVAEYFYRTYNRRLSFENLPCVMVRNDVYLPLEVCDILPGQRFDGQLTDSTHAEMIKHTCIKPSERFNRISRAVQGIFKHSRDQHINSIGMDVDKENMLIDGRVLDPPTVEYNSKSANQTHVPKDGRWNLLNKIVVQGKSLENWSVLVFSTKVPAPSIEQFMRQFRETANQKGLALYQACLDARINKELPPQLVFCIMEQTGPLYGEIKRVGDTMLGVPTQVLLSKLITRRSGLDQ